jgi:thymidylate synthase
MILPTNFKNAQSAFEFLYDYILDYGQTFDGTKAIFGANIIIDNPKDRMINTFWRKWKPTYAEKEWEWYLSGDPNAEEIAKDAKIWYNCMDDNGCVNSNYGYQWKRGNQLDKVIEMLRTNPKTRKASISLYDGKEIDKYKKDTICTYAIHFWIPNYGRPVEERVLNMSVMMRSNDLVYGFCTDQYCFSKLQELVADELGINVGYYNHFANNLHIYERHYDLKEKNINKIIN